MDSALSIDPLPLTELELYVAYQGAVAGEFRNMPTVVPHFTWWFIEKGPVTVEFQGKINELIPGSMIFFPVNFQRRHRFGEEARITSIGFKAAWSGARPWLEFPVPILDQGQAARRVHAKALAICKLLGATGKNSGLSLSSRRLTASDWCRVRAELLHFVAEISEWAETHGACRTEPTSGDARLDKILSLLEAAPMAGPLPYSMWQRAAGCSRSQLDRLATDLLGTTLRAWRDKLLVGAVRRDLQTAGYSMKELAAIYGFADAAHFSRWMRQHAGAAPSELTHPTV